MFSDRTRMGLGLRGEAYTFFWNTFHRTELTLFGRCSCGWCKAGFGKHRRWGG